MNYEAMSTEEIVGLLMEQACIYYSMEGEDQPFRSCPLCDRLMSAMNVRGLDFDHGNSAVYELKGGVV